MNFSQQVEAFFRSTLDALFPIRLGNHIANAESVDSILGMLRKILVLNIEESVLDLDRIVAEFKEQLLEIKNALMKDVDALYHGDPAAKSRNEVILAYPGFYATAAYRIAHFLLQKEIPLIPRIITEHAHCITGIDIHPGAKIGQHLCIDHGTGVVIGETCVIGDRVKIYQGVTLGALSVVNKNDKSKRHPTIENDVVIYAQATILGGNTTIGQNCVIGGNVWITESIPSNTKVLFEQGQYLKISRSK